LRRYSPLLLIAATRVGDALLSAAAGPVAHLITLHHLNSRDPIALFLAPLFTALTAQIFGFYTFKSLIRLPINLIGIAIAWSAAFVMVLITSPDGTDQGWAPDLFACWFTIGLGLLLAGRVVVRVLVVAGVNLGRVSRRVALVGGGEAAEQLINALHRQPKSGIEILGIFDDRGAKRSPDFVANVPKLGTVADLLDYSRVNKVDMAIVTLPASAEARIRQMLSKLWVLPIDIRLVAQSRATELRSSGYSDVAGVPVFKLVDKPMTSSQLVCKGVFDRLVGLFLLICILPLLITTAMAIKLDSAGPVLFRQKRYGFNNKLIEVLKFRSMYSEQCDPLGSAQVTRDDSRVTRVGKLIRSTSIDELPQLFNVVFKGDLSLVGPRPHAPESKAGSRRFDQVLDEYFARHKVKPGMTGWAQINGWRGETDTEEKLRRRVEHDLDYINRWSVLRDLYILAMTPFSLVKAKGAY
jgi:Undecaprenyl-phosphate glucose phosphotransferase